MYIEWATLYSNGKEQSCILYQIEENNKPRKPSKKLHHM